MDADEVFAFVQRVRTLSLLILGLALLLVILGAILFNRRVVTTLKNLSHSAQHIAAGNLQQRVPGRDGTKSGNSPAPSIP